MFTTINTKLLIICIVQKIFMSIDKLSPYQNLACSGLRKNIILTTDVTKGDTVPKGGLAPLK